AGDALRAVGEQPYQLILRAHRGKELHDLGDLTGAEAELRETVVQAERLGKAVPLPFVRVYLARLLAQMAPADFLDEPEQVARDVMSTPSPPIMVLAHGALAAIRCRQGDLTLAEREARAGCEAAREAPGHAWGIIALHASILIEQGRAE